MGNYCYFAVCWAAGGASAPTEGGEGREHIVAAARLRLVGTGFTSVLSTLSDLVEKEVIALYDKIICTNAHSKQKL